MHEPTHDTATLSSLIKLRATQSPSAIAVVTPNASMTYQQLDQAADTLAVQLLRNAGHGSAGVIGIVTSRSVETVVAILGVLRAGHSYIPLDPRSDHGELGYERILELVHPSLLITTNTDTIESDIPSTGVEIRSPSQDAPSLHGPDRSRPDGRAYLMPTSGTGGALKLVEISHRNIYANLTALATVLGGIRPTDRYLHYASFSFSSSVRQLFLPLAAGATVVLATDAQRLDPQQIITLMGRQKISITDLIPSFLDVLVDAIEHAGDRIAIHAPRMVLLASEPVPPVLIPRIRRAWKQRPPRIFNMYGQTETAGIQTVHEVKEIPGHPEYLGIGKPLPGTSIDIVSDTLEPLPEGEVGEMLIHGPGLSLGYYNDPTRTSEKFIRASDDLRSRAYRTGDLACRDAHGGFKFIGRTDRVIKISGHKVDLNHYEATMLAHPSVSEVMAVPHSTDGIRVYVQLRRGFIDDRVGQLLRPLPNGLQVLDLNPPETDFLYEEIFQRNVYMRHGITIPKNAVVIDAGANIGLFSLSIATKYVDATVYAFEPAPQAASVLRTNVRANSSVNITVYEQGLSDKSRNATLTYYPHNTGMSSIYGSDDEERAVLQSVVSHQLDGDLSPEGVELNSHAAEIVEAKLAKRLVNCRLIRLSDFLIEHPGIRIDLLKIDVQKSELDLLNGIDEDHWNRIDQIVAEVHDLDNRRERITSELTRRGFEVSTSQDAMLTGTVMYFLHARRPGHVTSIQPDLSHQPKPAIPVSANELTAHLAVGLSEKPSSLTVEILPEFPRTRSGKIDRSAVVAADRLSLDPTPLPIDDPLVSDISKVWSQVLGKPVHPHTNFFDVGGNSLKAARVITRIKESHCRDVTIIDLFDEPHLDKFAEAVRRILGSRGSSGAEAVREEL
ncbi:FkbM family methyltransferase [Nocardia sp. NPDC056952]|uniref:FkbM family methyltransferase n=1 Tax=Nocardia sp. NPDC056952 TaxID=3345979 RepID=UPI00362647A0